jgi:predicted RNase H-like nuclease (RuvC/YqgF family)
MDLAAWAPLIGLLGLLAAPVVAYLVARRSSSGRVATTEAATLWAELRAELIALRQRAERLEAKIDELQSIIEQLRAELREVQRRGQ